MVSWYSSLVGVVLDSWLRSRNQFVGFLNVQHGGSKQVGFKQLGPGIETGVHDEKRVWFEVELQGAQGDREAEVFQVSNDDIAVAQRRLEDKQPEEKTNTDCLVKEQEKEYQNGWKIKTSNVLDSCNQSLVCLRSSAYSWDTVKGIVGNKLWRLDDITSKVVLYSNMGFNESGEYKKTFIGSGVSTGSMQVLQGDEFEVEPQDGHTFEGAALSMGTIQYRKDSNEAAFTVAAVEKIYAHESLTFNYTVACEVISKWKAGLKDYMDARMDARSDVYVLSNGCKKCSDDNDGYYWEYTPAKGNVLGIEIVKDQSGNTLRVSQSKIHNEKLLEAKSIPLVCTRPDLASGAGYGLCWIVALLTTKAGYVTFTEAWKKEIWLKGLLTESRYELRLVVGIATGAWVKGCSHSEVPDNMSK
ncbi:hypothetical protein Tco_1173932 [Tanacetum coccineum]